MQSINSTIQYNRTSMFSEHVCTPHAKDVKGCTVEQLCAAAWESDCPVYPAVKLR